MAINEQLEQEIVQTAIDNLETTTGFKAHWKPGEIKELDGELDIQIHGHPMHFLLEIKRELRNHTLPKIFDQAVQYKNLMVVANRITPDVKVELRQKHIAYLEGNGNIFIDKKPTFIWINDNKPLNLRQEKTNRAFTKAGLQVVFLFLTEPTFINEPYRTIAEATGTALGNINNVIKGLLAQDFLLKKNGKELMINNKKALLDKWITYYDEKLKPTLHMGNFRFLENKEWRDLNLNPEETVWGGEPAGDILTNFLRPETFTLYTTLPRNEMMKEFRLIPDQQGEVRVYRKFWKHPVDHTTKTTHPFLVYADLMNMNNKRCRETAQLVYERYIQPEL